MHQANLLIRRANSVIRTARPPEQDAWRHAIREQQVTMDPRPSPVRTLTFVYFRSFGCRYDRAGECTMCNYAVAERVDTESIVESVREALETRDHYDALGISPFGNMFDVSEVPAVARESIISMAGKTDAAIFSCESRPETLSDGLIAQTVDSLPGKRFFINLGLEAANPWVQANCVGKSLDAADFRTATAALRRNDAFPVSNVLLGAPFLTEEEAMTSAVGTIRWALGNGSHLCVLFPSNVKGWTLQEWLWERGLFRTPSLWALVETLRRLGADDSRAVVLSWYSATPTDPHRLGQVSDPLREAPTTCPLCREQVIAALDAFNAGGDFGIIEQLTRSDCACRQEWLARVTQEAGQAAPLISRVLSAYDRIGQELVSSSWWEGRRSAVAAELAVGYNGSVVPAGA